MKKWDESADPAKGTTLRYRHRTCSVQSRHTKSFTGQKEDGRHLVLGAQGLGQKTFYLITWAPYWRNLRHQSHLISVHPPPIPNEAAPLYSWPSWFWTMSHSAQLKDMSLWNVIFCLHFFYPHQGVIFKKLSLLLIILFIFSLCYWGSLRLFIATSWYFSPLCITVIYIVALPFKLLPACCFQNPQ